MLSSLRLKLHQTFSAQETYDPIWERALDAGQDAGYFSHDSAVWVVHGGMSPIAAGIRALLTQALHPGALAGVAEHSNYQADPLARLAGTIRWIFTLTYGDATAADAACAWVRKLHVPVTGEYVSATGENREYSANDPGLSDWVHIAFADAFLRCHEAFTGPVPQGADAYVREWAKAGELMGVANPPRSEAELREAIAGYESRGELSGGPRVAEVVSFLKNPPLDPAVLPGYKLLFAAVVETLPKHHQKLLGLEPATLGPVTLPSKIAGKAVLGLAGLVLDKRGPAELAARRRLYRIGALSDLNYADVGMTEHGRIPAEYSELKLREPVGHGKDAFEALAEGILNWKLHERSGLRTRPDTPRVQLGSLVHLGFGVGPLRINAPCRVVRLIQDQSRDETRTGFAYGTLAGHPETGEESFAAVLGADGTVYLEISAGSQHSTWFYRLVSPVSAAVQRYATRRYVAAARLLATTTG